MRDSPCKDFSAEAEAESAKASRKSPGHRGYESRRVFRVICMAFSCNRNSR